MRLERVADEEVLYRRIQPIHLKHERSKVRLSSQAFADKSWRPSVDRACLIGNDPAQARQHESDLVVSISARQVREIHTVVQQNAQGEEIQRHAIDVEPVPLEYNPAHAEIFGTPGFANKRVFQRLLERLAFLAHFEISPDAQR